MYPVPLSVTEASKEEPFVSANQRPSMGHTPSLSSEEEFCLIDDPGLGIAVSL